MGWCYIIKKLFQTKMNQFNFSAVSFISTVSFIALNSKRYQFTTSMKVIDEITKPTKEEQRIAGSSHKSLIEAIAQLDSEKTEIEIEESKEKIVLPVRALKLLGEILFAMSEGKQISIIPLEAEVSTQRAAEMLGCSRPHLVKLLESNEIEYTKVGRHRRILMEDVLNYKHSIKSQQKKHLIELMQLDEEAGMYDS